MKVTHVRRFALLPLVGVAVLATGATMASDPFAESGFLKIVKECTAYTGQAGSFCTITSSNIRAIPVGSKVFYVQAANILPGLLDSNVIVDAGNGNRAVGRCTLDLQTGVGLCTFSDGTGRLAGFEARADVSPPADGVHWYWNGTYEFKSVGIGWPPRSR